MNFHRSHLRSLVQSLCIQASTLQKLDLCVLRDNNYRWWFQPIWKRSASQIGSCPEIGMNMKRYLKPPPRDSLGKKTQRLPLAKILPIHFGKGPTESPSFSLNLTLGQNGHNNKHTQTQMLTQRNGQHWGDAVLFLWGFSTILNFVDEKYQ